MHMILRPLAQGHTSHFLSTDHFGLPTDDITSSGSHKASNSSSNVNTEQLLGVDQGMAVPALLNPRAFYPATG
jgi:hypothetical protein